MGMCYVLLALQYMLNALMGSLREGAAAKDIGPCTYLSCFYWHQILLLFIVKIHFLKVDTCSKTVVCCIQKPIP
jgi:hypothetical protein